MGRRICKQGAIAKADPLILQIVANVQQGPPPINFPPALASLVFQNRGDRDEVSTFKGCRRCILTLTKLQPVKPCGARSEVPPLWEAHMARPFFQPKSSPISRPMKPRRSQSHMMCVCPRVSCSFVFLFRLGCSVAWIPPVLTSYSVRGVGCSRPEPWTRLHCSKWHWCEPVALCWTVWSAREQQSLRTWIVSFCFESAVFQLAHSLGEWSSFWTSG